ncbi:MAG: hypothetical protein KJI71_01575 [Patescibacteria group bacterium]|nr:hypothetical protein [Patescibacteria group bacterium]
MNECELCGKKTNWIEMKTLELCCECAADKTEREFDAELPVNKISIKSEEIGKGFQNITLDRRYESNLDAILDMLDHYFARKLITNTMMGKALRLLKRKQNPFINKEFLDSMKKRAEKQGHVLAHEVFEIKLKNDR